MQSVQSVLAVENVGLQGDRYALGVGSYSNHPKPHDVTLMAMEALWELEGTTGINLHPGQTRRNLLTNGVSLLELIGREIRIGPVILRGLRPCPPCQHLVRLTGIPPMLKGLAHSGGIYAQIISGGTLTAGDPIAPLSV
jgi:MOSC domain-containing protein YiiM